MLTLLIISFMLNIIFIFLNHPMSFGMILLFQTIIISLLSGFMNLNFWFSYIIFLIMIGGMLILFIYMTSIASNEKFKFNNKLFFSLTIMMMLMTILLITDYYLFNLVQNNYDLIPQDLTSKFNWNLIKFINYPNNNIFYLLIIYLLITLIMVVKITNIKSGPLRQK